MRKLKVIVLVIYLFLLSGCSSQHLRKSISNEIGIHLPKKIEISSYDAHSGFNGDGTTFTMIKFKEKDIEKVRTNIKENDNWNELPLTENLQLIMYGGTKNNVEYMYHLAKEVGMPIVHNGYWIFIDRFDNLNTLNDDSKLFDRHSFNFTIAIYDTDTDILYYCKNDT